MAQSQVPTTASNPSHLPSRYEIRPLTEKEIPWICAVVVHTNLFHNKFWSTLYPEGLVKRCYAGFDACHYLAKHQVDSGHSFGVFDTEYEYKTEEARKEGGKLLWDPNNTEASGATGEVLLRQMDFPLVSVALAYDGINALDMEKMGPLLDVLPLFGLVYHVLEEMDPRDPSSWKPKGPNEVLLRNATSTRHDYEGRGLMKKLAQWLMRYADGLGFRGIQIECLSDAVAYVWSHPPEPYKGIVVSEFDSDKYTEEQEVDGVKQQVHPFGAAVQHQSKIYVELKPQS